MENLFSPFREHLQQHTVAVQLAKFIAKVILAHTFETPLPSSKCLRVHVFSCPSTECVTSFGIPVLYIIAILGKQRSSYYRPHFIT